MLLYYAQQMVYIWPFITELIIVMAVVSGRVSITGADETAYPRGAGKTVRW